MQPARRIAERNETLFTFVVDLIRDAAIIGSVIAGRKMGSRLPLPDVF